MGTRPDFLLLKARYLDLIGDAAQAQAAFDSVPDEALRDPAHLARRLEHRYVLDQVSAIPLARRLATDGGASAEALFVSWVHDSLARHFPPPIQPVARDNGYSALLRALGEPSDALGFTISTTAGLRMWVEATETPDPDRLHALAQITFSDAPSYGPRYQLLLADLLERRGEPELRADARAIRRRFLAAVDERSRGAARPELVQRPGVLEYWMAFARAREAAADRAAAAKATSERQRADLRGRASLGDQNAAIAMVNGHRPEISSWSGERERLAGPDDYLTRAARDLEDLAERLSAQLDFAGAAGAREYSLQKLVELTRIDGSAVTLLQAAAARLRPESSWDEFWTEQLLQFKPTLPSGSLSMVGEGAISLDSLRGRWFLLGTWNTSCRSCEQDLRSLDAIAREFSAVLAIAVNEPASRVKRYQVLRNLHVPVGVASRDIATRIGITSAATLRFLVAPDGRFFRLPGIHWEAVARHFLSKPAPQAH